MKTYNFGYVLFISCVAALGGFLFGFDSAVINGTITAIQDAFGSSSIGSGFSVASMLIGCAVGAGYAGNLADKTGRKPVMIAASLFFIVSALGSGLAGNVAIFVVFRLLGGLAVGAASVIAPAYIAEMAPAAIRGSLASLQQLAIVIGIFVAFLSNYTIASISGGARETFAFGFAAWQWMFWAEALPAALYLVCSFVVPESPRYLVAAKHEDEAKEVLCRVWVEHDIDGEIDAIRHTVNRERKPRFSDIFPGGRLLPIVVVGIMLSVFQQFVGINVVFYYGSVLWEAAGFTEKHALFINIISGTINVISTFFAIVLIDRVGRKPLLVVGSAGMTLTLGTLAVVFSMAGVDEAGKLMLGKSAGLCALVAANLYVFCFGVSWGPVVWVLLGEMFNNKIRGAAISAAAAMQWVANFLITVSFPVILSTTGLFGAYGLYTLFAFLSVLFVLKFVTETKGKTLEQM